MNLKIYTRLLLFAVILFSFLFLNSGTALATGAAYFSADTTLQITVGGTVTNFTIKSGSDADSLTVNASSFAVTISAGESFIVTSAGRLIFTNDGGYSTNCLTVDSSSITITGAKTVTVTPDASECPALGGGGGGGGGSYVAATPTPTPTPASTSTPTPTPTTTPTATPSVTPSLTTTPTPAVSLGPTSIQVLSSVQKLNVRKGAGTNYGVIGQIKGNDIYQKLDEKSGWIKIMFNGKEGWVIKTYIKSSAPTPTPTPIPTTAVITQLFRKANDPKVYVQRSDGVLSWVRTLEEFNAGGYRWSDVKLISGSEFAKMKVSGKIRIAKGIAFLRVRSGPSTANSVVGQVLPDQELNFTEIKNGWYHIDSGWVSGGYAKEF